MSIDICLNKHGGNAASNEAYRKGEAGHANARQRIYELIAASPAGLTSKEIASKLDWALHRFSGRLAEMKRDGLLREAGARRYGAEVLEVVRVPEQVSLWEAA